MAFDRRLGRAFVFTAEDLTANRRGELSDDQRAMRRNTGAARRRHGRRATVWVVLACAAAAVAVVLVGRATPGTGTGTIAVTLGIVAVFAVVLIFLARLNRRSADAIEAAVPLHVEGPLELDWAVLLEVWILIVGGVRFQADRLQYESVEQGASYSIHYLPAPEGPWILSIERS
jgi:uncharacterized membrane protein